MYLACIWQVFELFDYQIDDGLLEYEAMKYYSNIIMPFAQFVV